MESHKTLETRTDGLEGAVRRIERHWAMLAELAEAQALALLELRELRRRAGGPASVEPSLAEIERQILHVERLRGLLAEPAPGLKRALPRVLLIDDDPTTRNLISHFLRKENFVVEKAADGPDGLARARSGKPDLIILDVIVPGLGGFEILSQLRRSPETATIPVLILSSLEEEEAIVKGLEEGADYITKPFSPRVLVAKVKNILRECGGHAADHRRL